MALQFIKERFINDPSYVQLVQIDIGDTGRISVDKSGAKQEFYIFLYETDRVYTLSVPDKPTETFQTVLDFMLNDTEEFQALKQQGTTFTFELTWVDDEIESDTAAFLVRPIYGIPLAKGRLIENKPEKPEKA